MSPQMDLREHFLTTSVYTVLSSRWRRKLEVEENPKQETESAKSDAGKLGWRWCWERAKRKEGWPWIMGAYGRHL